MITNICSNKFDLYDIGGDFIDDDSGVSIYSFSHSFKIISITFKREREHEKDIYLGGEKRGGGREARKSYYFCCIYLSRIVALFVLCVTPE